MIPLFNPEDVQAMDQRAFARGVDSAALMEHAAHHLTRGVLTLAEDADLPRYGLRVLMVCGKGNNGADGLAAARKLSDRGVAASAVLLASEEDLGEDGRRELAAFRSRGGRVWAAPDLIDDDADPVDLGPVGVVVRSLLADADIGVDCLLGTGASGEPRGVFGEAVAALADFHDAGGLVVACDLPTGVDATTGRVPGQAVTADLTVTLGAHKQGLWLHPAAEHTGALVLGEIGVVDDEAVPVARVLEAADLPVAVPPPGPRAHKRSRGVVVIYAGSARMAGAAVLVARGALAAGAGLVTVATPAEVAHHLTAAIPEAMTLPLPDGVDGVVETVQNACERADVLAMGPGLGLADDTQQTVRTLVEQTGVDVVLDADGINAYRDHSGELAEQRQDADHLLVLTPHAQELGRLAGLSGHGVHARRTEVAVEQAQRLQATVVAKGPRTVTAAPDGTVWINPTGGPGLASGGTGDVLTGVTAALQAQQPGPGTVAAGVYLHGLAGQLAAEAASERATVAGLVADHLGGAARLLGI